MQIIAADINYKEEGTLRSLADGHVLRRTGDEVQAVHLQASRGLIRGGVGHTGGRKVNKKRVCGGCAGRHGETQEVKNISEVKVTQMWSLCLQRY